MCASRITVCLISEWVAARAMTLEQITREVVDVIVKRSRVGKDYGIIVLPEV